MNERWFPPLPVVPGEVDRRLRAGAALKRVHCPVCGTLTTVVNFRDNLRESGYCRHCGAWNRIRQLALVVLWVANRRLGRSCHDIASLAAALRGGTAGAPPFAIYNTEAHGSIHDLLAGAPGYVASEYFGPDMASGTIHPSGVRHEDLQALSLGTGSVDLVISTDVFEHLPRPYVAHEEVARVLRPGGYHVFTVPFMEGAALDQVRARLDGDGVVEHLAEPLYHDDPIRPNDGALVFTDFGLEMLVRIAQVGLEPGVYRLYDRRRGIVGSDALVFVARKPLC